MDFRQLKPSSKWGPK